MNDASAWRVDLARAIAPRYSGHADVQMMVLGGSPTRGRSDPYSDLDVIAFWDGIPLEVLEGAPRLESERILWSSGSDDSAEPVGQPIEHDADHRQR